MKKFLINLKKIYPYAKCEKKYIILYILLSLVATIISLVVPLLGAKLIVNLTSSDLIKLIYTSLVILCVEILRNFIIYFSEFYSQLIYRNVLVKVQVKMGSEILKLNNKTLIDNGSGVFNQRINHDTSTISDLFPVLLNNIMNILTKMGIFIAIFAINKIMFIYLVLLVFLLYLVDSKRTNIKTNNMEKIKKQQEKVSSFSSELCRGAKDIKMLSSEKSFIKEYEKCIISVNDSSLNMMNTNRLYTFLEGGISDLGTFFFIVLMIYLLKNNLLTIPFAIVIYNYKNNIDSIIYYINGTLEYIKEFNLSTKRVFEIIDSKRFKKESFGQININKLDGNIKFDNVSFAYTNNKILDKLSFEIKPGETVSFVGKSGTGKTTIFNLLCKFYEVDNNMIFLDGMDINDLSRESIRDNMTIISQDPYIFNMSIIDNFKLVKSNTTFEKIKEVCTIACLDDYIESLPDKYETIIGEGGINLSGGQKQRLAIARALLQGTKIILFDEATSSLDNETQGMIQEAIDNMRGNYTILIIAHRFSTIINSDKIFYIEDGTLISSGSHLDLLNNCLAYKKLYKAEFKD